MYVCHFTTIIPIKINILKMKKVICVARYWTDFNFGKYLWQNIFLQYAFLTRYAETLYRHKVFISSQIELGKNITINRILENRDVFWRFNVTFGKSPTVLLTPPGNKYVRGSTGASRGNKFGATSPRRIELPRGPFTSYRGTVVFANVLIRARNFITVLALGRASRRSLIHLRRDATRP